MSRTIVNYDSTDRALQVTMNLFIDDVELAIAGEDARLLKFCTKHEVPQAEALIDSFINTHIKIKVDGRPIPTLYYLGKEQSEELISMYCFLEVEDVSPFSTLTITNDLLTEQFDDQRNMTTIQLDKRRVADFVFTVDTTTDTYDRQQ